MSLDRRKLTYRAIFEGNDCEWQKFKARYRPYAEFTAHVIVSRIYDLRRDESMPAGISNEDIEAAWPQNYPNAEHSGVYFIYDRELNLLYVGKSSGPGSSIGQRLGSYFKYALDNSCEIKHEWTATPRFISSIGMTGDFGFEADSLESYFLQRFELPDNVAGQGK
jgi:hypothetical protein